MSSQHEIRERISGQIVTALWGNDQPRSDQSVTRRLGGGELIEPSTSC